MRFDSSSQRGITEEDAEDDEAVAFIVPRRSLLLGGVYSHRRSSGRQSERDGCGLYFKVSLKYSSRIQQKYDKLDQLFFTSLGNFRESECII